MSQDREFVLDFGSTKLTCLAASADSKGRIRVDSIATVSCRGLQRGVVRDHEETRKAVDAVVRRVEQDLKQEVRVLTASVSGAHIASHNSKGFYPIYPKNRPIRREDVLQAITHSLQVPFPPDRERIQSLTREFRIDGEGPVGQPVGQPGSRLEVETLLITAGASAVNGVEGAITGTGRRVAQLVVAPLASALAVIPASDPARSTVVVDLGGGTTDVAWFDHGVLAGLASLPVSSGHITNDLALLLKVSPDEAERLKTRHGCALPGLVRSDEQVEVRQTGRESARPMLRQALCQIIHSRAREIAQLVQEVLLRMGLHRPPETVYVTGGGCRLQSMEILLAETLQCQRVSVAGPTVQGHWAELVQEPEMSTAVGLATFALDDEEQEFSPIRGTESWKERIRTLKSKFVGKG